MMSSYQPNTHTFMFDALYCEEKHWDDNDSINGEIIDNCFIESESENFPCLHFSNPNQNYFWDDNEELSLLLNKEYENEMYHELEENPSRIEAVEWMLKVIGYFSFSALTAVLAVNYLDRFLCINQTYREKPWMTHLAAVACLSLAAKVEETDVPLLLDFQVEECKYVFESKTIQRMELLVLTTLQWRMNPVTPLSFLDYITRKLPLKSHLCKEVLRRCQCLILSLVSDSRFMCYLPSAMATATMIYAMSNVDPCIGVDYHDQLIGILGIKKEKVDDCCRLIQEVATSDHFQSSNKRSMPCSPKGVMDMSFSCSESSNDSWAFSPIHSVSSSPEPLSKKLKFLSPSQSIS